MDLGQYRPIEFPFTKNGWVHELVERRGVIAVVRRSKGTLPAHFEVVRLRVMKPTRFIADPYEKYPSSEDWGTYGFTYRTIEEARERVGKLAA